MQERMPQYLHLPIQILWFDTNEIFIILIGYLTGLVFGGWAWLALVILPSIYIPYKRKQDRGFLPHQFYKSGFIELKGYPPPTAEKFHE